MTKIELTKSPAGWRIESVRYALDGDIYVRTEYKPVARMELGEIYIEGADYVAYDGDGRCYTAKSPEKAAAKLLAGLISFAA